MKMVRNQLLNATAKETKDRQANEHNVIIIGIQESIETEVAKRIKEDLKSVEDFFVAVGLDEVEIVKTRRIKSKKLASTVQGILQVVLKSSEDQRKVLARARYHAGEGFTGVFAREDRTESEQTTFNALNKQKNEKNSQLEKIGVLNKPFRYVIHRRDERVAPINFVESAKRKRSIFVSEAVVNNLISTSATGGNEIDDDTM